MEADASPRLGHTNQNSKNSYCADYAVPGTGGFSLQRQAVNAGASELSESLNNQRNRRKCLGLKAGRQACRENWPGLR